MEVSQILVQAAELLLRDQQNHKSQVLAAMCFLLAERYADVLSLLNQLLTPPEHPQEHRAFWLGQLESFRSLYLSDRRRSHVRAVLEQQNKMALVETSRTLVQLNAFFAHVQQGRHEQAWAILDRELQLLPTSRSDLVAKEEAYYKLDPLVQKAFPVLLEGTMQMLHQEQPSSQIGATSFDRMCGHGAVETDSRTRQTPRDSVGVGGYCG